VDEAGITSVACIRCRLIPITEPISETLETIANVFGFLLLNHPAFGLGTFSARNINCSLMLWLWK